MGRPLTIERIILGVTNNEATAYPFWCIVKRGSFGRENLLAGVWFNREDATAELEARRYNYGNKAYAFCFSGHNSRHLRALYDQVKDDGLGKAAEVLNG